MITTNKIFIATLITATLFSISSCKKEIPAIKKDSSITREETRQFAEQMLNLAFDGNGQAMSFKTDNFSCEVVTVDSLGPLYVKTYDYGSGCVSTEGEYRKGQMTKTYNSEDYLAAGTRIDITYNNFYNISGKVTGTTTIENTGPNGSGNRVISIVANTQIDRGAKGITQFDQEQYYEWVAGIATPQFDDDVFSVTGFYRNTAQNGNQSSVTVTQPLIRKRDPACKRYYVEGITLTQTTGDDDVTLNYGTGTCDDQAVETINGVSQTITLQ